MFFNFRQAALRGGNEYGRGLDLHDHTAACNFLHGAVQCFAAFDRSLNLRKMLADVQPLFGQEDGALGVVELRAHHFDRIADVEFIGKNDAAFGRNLVIRQDACVLRPEIDLDLGGIYRQYDARDPFPCI